MFSNQRGFIQVAVVLILLIGLGVGIYLVQKQTSLRSKASLDATRIEVFGHSVSGDRTSSRNIRLRLVYVLPAIAPAPSTEPSPPTGCHYEDVRCITAPCPRRLICPTSVPQPSCPSPPPCNGQLIHGDPSEGQCTSYFCIEPTPNPQTSQPVGKSGVNSFSVEGSCANGYTAVTYDCYDGYSNIETAPNGCASSETLQEVARRGCENQSSGNPYTKQTTVKGVASVYTQTSYPTHFRLANSMSELENASEQAFSQNGVEVDWVLPAGNGLKTIYAQFKINGSWEPPVSTTITLEIPLPTPTPPTPSPTAIPLPSATPIAAPSGDVTVRYSLSPGKHLIGVPVMTTQTFGQLRGTSRACSAAETDDRFVPNRPFGIDCISWLSIEITGTPYTQMPTFQARDSQQFSLPWGSSMTAEEFLNRVSNDSLDCNLVERWIGSRGLAGDWESHRKGESTYNFVLNDREGYRVSCRAIGSTSPTPAPPGEVCSTLYTRMRRAYLGSCGSSNYDPVPDVNKDQSIDSIDFSLIRRNSTNQSWCRERLADTSNPCAESAQNNTGFVQRFWQNIISIF